MKSAVHWKQVATRWPVCLSAFLALSPTYVGWSEPGRDWTLATPAAPWHSRVGHTSLVYNGKMWIILGDWGDGGDIWCSSNGSSWTRTLSRGPIGFRYRVAHTSVVYGGKMWVIGGAFDYGGTPFNDVWYSTNGTTWTLATAHAQWAPRSAHASVVYDGKMWIIGGYDGSKWRNDVWYSTNGTTWRLATARGPWSAGVYGHTALVFEAKMWVIAGNPYYNAAYSSNGTSWTVATGPWLNSLHGHGGVVCGRKMWVMGGLMPPPWFKSTNEVWSSTDGVTWGQVLPYGYAPWVPRENFAMVVHDRKMWILGGAYYTGSSTYYLNDVWYSQFPAETTAAWKLYR